MTVRFWAIKVLRFGDYLTDVLRRYLGKLVEDLDQRSTEECHRDGYALGYEFGQPHVLSLCLAS